MLATALAELTALPWTCDLVGALTRDPAYVDRLRRQLADAGLAGRVRLRGPRTGAALDAAYARGGPAGAAVPGRDVRHGGDRGAGRGVPVLGTEVGGLPEALGHAPGGGRPGLLVPPGDPAALAGALRRWLTEPDLRARLRVAARARRDTLADWAVTTTRLATALKEATAT
ncbi:glycosyltransferase [Micromonospora sp. R77]|uniref:glycosyltransferase n=1 Tax=Micromonospora sp. R77 TaxID=2925836 RepID=UPI001F602C22|nr:glycosyltransferase [Micromonospora sp. R77]MCI4065690.1 glycosyltransferase [Micromonospora sp. R77]